jgi:hypothetical protein
MDDIFWAYAKHEQEKQDIINAFCSGHPLEEVDDWYSEEELREIENKICGQANWRIVPSRSS